MWEPFLLSSRLHLTVYCTWPSSEPSNCLFWSSVVLPCKRISQAVLSETQTTGGRLHYWEVDSHPSAVDNHLPICLDIFQQEQVSCTHLCACYMICHFMSPPQFQMEVLTAPILWGLCWVCYSGFGFKMTVVLEERAPLHSQISNCEWPLGPVSLCFHTELSMHVQTEPCTCICVWVPSRFCPL